MQTFKAQSNTPNSSPDPEPLVKKDEYVPFIPGQSTPENSLIQNQPEQSISPSPENTPPLYHYQPEYNYLPPTQKQFSLQHMGMDREKFRKMIIGLAGLTLLIFIIIIAVFSKKAQYPHPVFPDIYIAEPKAGSRISMPLTILGQAQEHWFFEKAFPITIYDKENIPVAHGFARATADQPLSPASILIPFQTTIDGYFFPPQSKKGYVVLQRGTGEDTTDVFDESGVISIPITFGKEGRDRIVPENTDTKNGNGAGAGSNNNGGSGTGTQPPIGTAEFECSDDKDNDNDGLVDTRDPHCHTDLSNSNSATYDPQSNESSKFGTGSGGGSGDGSGSGSGSTGGGSGSDTGGSTGDTSSENVYGFTGKHSGIVTVYMPNGNNNPWSPDCGTLYPVSRSVGAGSLGSTVLSTVEALANGPNERESSSGYVSALRTGLSVEDVLLGTNGTLSLYFSQSSIASSVPWCDRSDAKKALVQTMSQFAGVERVVVYANGRAQ